MATSELPTLFRLSETTRTVADPAADVRGRTVVDSNDEEIGRVDDLLVDDQEIKVRFLRIGEGGFLGLGKQHYLIPVDAIVAIEDDLVRINRERGHLSDAPAYDPELAEEPTYYAEVYDWWGYGPFWGSGYNYPPFPYFR